MGCLLCNILDKWGIPAADTPGFVAELVNDIVCSHPDIAEQIAYKAGYKSPEEMTEQELREKINNILRENILLHSMRGGQGVFTISSFKKIENEITALIIGALLNCGEKPEPVTDTDPRYIEALKLIPPPLEINGWIDDIADFVDSASEDGRD